MKKIKFVTLVLTILTSIAYAQDFEKTKKKLENPEHGQYHPDQYKQGYPYTTFYKPLDNNYIENIRIKITGKETRDYFQPIYNSIYDQAKITFTSTPGLTGKNDDAAAKNAYYAKHAAFFPLRVTRRGL